MLKKNIMWLCLVALAWSRASSAQVCTPQTFTQMVYAMPPTIDEIYGHYTMGAGLEIKNTGNVPIRILNLRQYLPTRYVLGFEQINAFLAVDNSIFTTTPNDRRIKAVGFIEDSAGVWSKPYYAGHIVEWLPAGATFRGGAFSFYSGLIIPIDVSIGVEFC